MKHLTCEEERQLLDECLNHERCDELVGQYGGVIYSRVREVFAIRGAAPLKEDLDEAFQDVFLQLFDDNRRRLRLYREGEGHSLGRWIGKIASNAAKNYLRKKGFDGPFGRSQGEELDDDGLVAPEFPDIETMKRLSLTKALEGLPLMDRITFRLRLYGMSSKEIATVIESSQGGVDNRISKIKSKLKKLVDE